LLQVTIPKDACPTPSALGTSLLDINVATPNGASNHLLIKMRPADPRRKQHQEEKTETLAKEAAVAFKKSARMDAGLVPARMLNSPEHGRTTTPGASADPKLLFLVPAL
jgi:hypothetical protein